ncbi:hypothetical protein BJ912DRAFT_925748 [Pholiota molesta]|nr:hypothetical protein BJ912DRAFT_925748 [Pholiota molesta]
MKAWKWSQKSRLAHYRWQSIHWSIWVKTRARGLPICGEKQIALGLAPQQSGAVNNGKPPTVGVAWTVDASWDHLQLENVLPVILLEPASLGEKTRNLFFSSEKSFSNDTPCETNQWDGLELGNLPIVRHYEGICCYAQNVVYTAQINSLRIRNLSGYLSGLEGKTMPPICKADVQSRKVHIKKTPGRRPSHGIPHPPISKTDLHPTSTANLEHAIVSFLFGIEDESWCCFKLTIWGIIEGIESRLASAQISLVDMCIRRCCE